MQYDVREVGSAKDGKRCRYIDEFDELDMGRIAGQHRGQTIIDKEYQNGRELVVVPSEKVLEVER